VTKPIDRDLVVLRGVIVLGAIMSILDATIVNVAVPTLARRFDASVAAIQWVVTAYLLAFAAVIPLSGWLTQRFGAKPVWIAALILFMNGSILAGLSWSLGSLVVFRVVQGLGGGLIMPVGQAILARAAGPERMGRVMSVVGIPMLLAPVFGPVLGGVLVDDASWRWIFFVNLPVGALALLLAIRLLPRSAPQPVQRLDVRGLFLLLPGLALSIYGLSQVGVHGTVAGARTLVPLLAGVALLASFVPHAVRLRSGALLDLTLLQNRGFAAASATTLLLGIALFGALILLPLYYQLVRGESALATGLLLMPQGIGAALAMPVAGWLTDRSGARAVIPLGIVVPLVGALGLTRVEGDTSYALLASALFVIGLGLGSTIMPAMAAAFASVPRDAIEQATSSINVVQRVAGSLGTALLAVVLQRQLPAHSPATAFARSFWVAVALVALALVPALLLPRRRERMASRPATAA
jgi:EmrB/QacA subfamily drug resistance transporter